jgi:hypothetical protein
MFRNAGVLECRSVGVLARKFKNDKFPMFYFFITPSLHYSSTPVLNNISINISFVF